MNMQGIQIIDPMINMRSSFRKYKLKHKFEQQLSKQDWKVGLSNTLTQKNFTWQKCN